MNEKAAKIQKEKKTLEIMIQIYCRAKHETRSQLCDSCQDIFDYAVKRLNSCPLLENKPTCAKCPIHCYAPEYREKIREIMRFSGPRMLYSHPFLAINHLSDLLKKRK
ncbi:MAG: nitrous oxide-stimulated promoter family protein [Promethearchaeia archaeon]|nr:MAG: nitrous oxide-stimulated promoter family protein [Candidatus Lokiarchaeia archaeon]